MQDLTQLLALANLNQSDPYTVFMALNAIDYHDREFVGLHEEIRSLPKKVEGMQRTGNYPGRLIEKILEDF